MLTVADGGAAAVPGLLQTPAYTEAVFRGGRLTGDGEVKRRVEARMARREILNRFEPVHLRAVIDEAVLHRSIGGAAVMREQLEYLLHTWRGCRTSTSRCCLSPRGRMPG
ncbi:DUF5753 domain-containing protein [Nocardiopsis sp. CNT-189]|uniref:DUF5753 domain-containing protein n=1 Tax=Nocardiopsis oceanisediminis TaxID=2816862 RepID=UPI003B3BA442